MKSQKYIAQHLAFNIFRISLYGLATVIALYIVFADSATIKKAFIDTNAYNRFVPLNIEVAIKLDQNTEPTLIKDPIAQQIIMDSFSSAILRMETERIIDSSYVWLNGQADKPTFVVDFAPSIDTLANKLSVYGVQRLQSLPVCEVSSGAIDPFTATCKPKNIDSSLEQTSLEAAIREDNGLIEQTTYTIDDFPKTADGKSLIEQYSYLPSLYKGLLYAPIILLLITISSAIIAIRLDRNKRYATRRVGTSIIGATIFLIASPIFYIYILPYFIPSMNVDTSAGGGSIVFGDVVSRLGMIFSNQLIIVSSMLLMIGLIVLILERITRPKSKYVKVNKKSGLISSDVPRKKNKSGKTVISEATVPIQTSEGKKQSSKYQKDKRYRKIAKKEF